MPIEVFDTEQFVELSENAEECRVKRNKDNTKLKLRTKKHLYTIKLDPEEAGKVLGRISCTTVEI